MALALATARRLPRHVTVTPRRMVSWRSCREGNRHQALLAVICATATVIVCQHWWKRGGYGDNSTMLVIATLRMKSADMAHGYSICFTNTSRRHQSYWRFVILLLLSLPPQHKVQKGEGVGERSALLDGALIRRHCWSYYTLVLSAVRARLSLLLLFTYARDTVYYTLLANSHCTRDVISHCHCRRKSSYARQQRVGGGDGLLVTVISMPLYRLVITLLIYMLLARAMAPSCRYHTGFQWHTSRYHTSVNMARLPPPRHHVTRRNTATVGGRHFTFE